MTSESLQEYIYGAGKIGNQCKQFLESKGVRNVLFLAMRVDAACNSKGLCAIDDVVFENDTIVIIAGNIKNSIEMHTELVEQNHL